jgi:hypothetical protein
MRQSRTEGLAVSGFNVSTIAVVVVVSAMWLATVADRLLHLGWGWDRQILWIAPIIVVGAMLVRVIGHGVFRLVGAAPPRAP